MKRSSKVAVVSVAVIVGSVFFLVPLSYWYTQDCGTIGFVCGVTGSHPVYRSLGCAAVGVGTLYSPDWFGPRLGCRVFPPGNLP